MNNAVKFCPACGAKNQPSSRFCSGCGENIENVQARQLMQSHSTTEKKSNIGKIFATILVIVICFFAISVYIAIKKEQSAKETPVHYATGVHGELKDDMFLCDGILAVGHLSKAAKNKDYEYLKRLQDEGEVLLIKKGTFVKYDEKELVDGYVFVSIQSGYHTGKTGLMQKKSIK